jgi:hypothetical protein
MNAELFLAFLLITFVLVITPGPIVTLESLIKTFVARLDQVLCGEIFLVVPGVDGSFSGTDGFGDRPAYIDRIG